MSYEEYKTYLRQRIREVKEEIRWLVEKTREAREEEKEVLKAEIVDLWAELIDLKRDLITLTFKEDKAYLRQRTKEVTEEIRILEERLKEAWSEEEKEALEDRITLLRAKLIDLQERLSALIYRECKHREGAVVWK